MRSLRDSSPSDRAELQVCLEMRALPVADGFGEIGDKNRIMALLGASNRRVHRDDLLRGAQEAKASVVPSHLPSHR